MKNYITLLLFCVFFNCKTEKKQNPLMENKLNAIVKTDSVKTDSVKINKNHENVSVLEHFIGKTIDNIESSNLELKKYSTGFSTINHLEEASTFFSLRVYSGPKNMTKVILLLKTENDFSKIIDVLDLRKEEILKNENYSVNNHFCYKNGKPDEEIIAIAKDEEDEEYLTDIYKAWRADCKIEKFIEIPVKGIKVENMGYGI